MEQHEIKRSLAPNLWQSLVKGIERECELINQTAAKRIVFDPIGSVEVRLKTSQAGARMTLQFDVSTPCVWYSTAGLSGYLAFKVAEDGREVVFFDPKREVVLFADEAAKYLLRHVLSAL